MKTTTTAARKLLRESNQVAPGAFADSAGDRLAQATLQNILATSFEQDHPSRRPWARSGPAAPADPERAQARWRFAAPSVITAAVAAAVAVTVTLAVGGVPWPGNPTSRPPAPANDAALYLTFHQPANPDDAAAVLRALADAAATQPSPALGPVEYAKTLQWGLDLGAVHYDLNYRAHEQRTDQDWMGPGGASLSVSTYPGGKIPPGIIPVSSNGPNPADSVFWDWYNPATLPADPAALRQHLLSFPPPPCSGGPCYNWPPPRRPAAQEIVNEALNLMSSEPLPPSVRASMLRLMADEAAQQGPDARFTDMGTATDRAGHTGIAVGFEIPEAAPIPVSLQVLIFDPGTGALLAQEYASCDMQLGASPVSGQCFLTSYSQYVEITAVPAVPVYHAG